MVVLGMQQVCGKFQFSGLTTFWNTRILCLPSGWVTVVLLPASSNKQLAYCLCPGFFFFPLLLNITENLLTVRASRPKIVAPGLVRLATHWQNLSSFPVPSAAGFIMNCSRSSCDLAATPTGVLSRTDKKKKKRLSFSSRHSLCFYGQNPVTHLPQHQTLHDWWTNQDLPLKSCEKRASI